MKNIEAIKATREQLERYTELHRNCLVFQKKGISVPETIRHAAGSFNDYLSHIYNDVLKVNPSRLNLTNTILIGVKNLPELSEEQQQQAIHTYDELLCGLLKTHPVSRTLQKKISCAMCWQKMVRLN